MDPARWKAIESLFLEVADISAAARAERLAVAAPDLRAAVERLLESDQASGAAIQQAIEDGEAALAHSDKRFGPWRVEGVLGHGGMASVFRVVRDDGAFRQVAALKILQFGQDSPAARERTRQERQFLASLHHPAIARLIDGGETSDGRPYIVLEYVEGETIIEYAERLGLPRERRLRLFLEVCEAVSHAHQALIAHRDLKPSNILVTAEGHVKLLDFGIAKLLDSDSTSTTTLALTPQYASPEQVRGEPVTTATDVYSLGLVLYELLTGRQAYKIPTASPAEIDRLVSETAPDPANLSPDLDNILLMALRKEPQRRYPSVRELAADIERSLDDRPVLARPDSLGYRAGKFVRRHRVGLAAGVLLTLTLAGGVVASQYQARQAERRFNDVRRLANRFLFEFDTQIAPVPGTTKARELLVSTAAEYLDNLARDTQRDVTLQAELAAAYEKLGDVQGRPSQPSLGRFADALASYQHSRQLWQAVLAARPVDHAALRSAASVTAKAAEVQTWTHKVQEAAGTIEEAARLAERAIRVKPEDNDSRFLAASIRFREGDVHRVALGDDAGEKAVSAYEQALQQFRVLAAKAPTPRNRNGVCLTLGRIALIKSVAGQLLESRALLVEAVAIARDLSREVSGPAYHASLASNLGDLATITGLPEMTNLGETEFAERCLREALAIREKIAAADPNDRIARHSRVLHFYQLGSIKLERDPGEALRYARMAQAAAAKDDVMSNVLNSLSRAALVEAKALTALGQTGEALRILRAMDEKRIDNSGGGLTRLAVGLATAEAEMRVNKEAARRTISDTVARVPTPVESTLNDLRFTARSRRLLAELDPARACEQAAAERAIWEEWKRRRAPARYLPSSDIPCSSSQR